MTVLFGGKANPMGAVVHFLEAPVDQVINALPGEWDATTTGRRLIEALPTMLPFEAGWSRILASSCGSWTALVNNFLYGGDSTAPGPALSRMLRIRCALASCVPRYGPGNQQTQLELFGSISATATDGRWEWFVSGNPLDFEDARRYSARRIKDRFDRELLLDYLQALGIPAGSDDAYGSAILLQRRVSFTRREMTLEEARADFSR